MSWKSYKSFKGLAALDTLIWLSLSEAASLPFWWKNDLSPNLLILSYNLLILEQILTKDNDSIAGMVIIHQIFLLQKLFPHNFRWQTHFWYQFMITDLSYERKINNFFKKYCQKQCSGSSEKSPYTTFQCRETYIFTSGNLSLCR